MVALVMRIGSKASKLFTIYALVLVAAVGAGFFAEAVGLVAGVVWAVVASVAIGALAWRWIRAGTRTTSSNVPDAPV